MSHPNNLAAYYDAIAQCYDPENLSSQRRLDEALLAEAGLNELANRHVLEIACGTGRWTKRLCAAARNVVASDLSQTMLSISRTRNQDQANVTHVCADAYRLPFRPGSFDGVFAGWWLSHVPRESMWRFFMQLRQVLVPTGRVVFTDDTQQVHEELSGPDQYSNTYAIRPLPDGRKCQILKNLYCEADLKAILSPFCSGITYIEGEYHWLLACTLRRPTDA